MGMFGLDNLIVKTVAERKEVIYRSVGRYLSKKNREKLYKGKSESV